MKAHRMLFCWIIGTAFIALSGNAARHLIAGADNEPRVLAKIDVRDRVDRVPLPLFAHLHGPDAADYALSIAPLSQIQLSGFSYQILDMNAEPGAYVIATRLNGKQSTPIPAHLPKILSDDGIQIVIRASDQEAGALSDAGFEIVRFPDFPLVFRPDLPSRPNLHALNGLTVDPLPEVRQMMSNVIQEKLYSHVGNLSGEWSTTVGGQSYTIATRYTASGTPIAKATQYAYEFMQSLGLQVSYCDWTSSSYSGRNVVATKTGTLLPDEIVLITAHIDDRPSSGIAPGADDNASGAVGVLMAAEAMSSHLFQRTIRFVIFTGEEQGLLGSKAYADAAYAAGDNIVSVLNLDMIAWDSIGGPVAELHTRGTSDPNGYAADKAIADMFINVVSAYGLSASIAPVIKADALTASDHYAFWIRGFPAVLAIEDKTNDFCANYHTINDRLSTLNLSYYANFVKAAIGAGAHLAIVDGVTSQDCDYDNDGKSDIGVWRASSGMWYTLLSGTPGAWTSAPWGLPDDVAVPADYDGDGKTDIAVWRPGTGVWYIKPSASPGTFRSIQWGLTGDKALPCDYDGDGKADIAVWRPSLGVWYILSSATPGTYMSRQWGVHDDVPVPADYDHDKKADIAVWRKSTAMWYILPSGMPGSYIGTQWGLDGDKPVMGDYDGDGKSDIAVWRAATGFWYILLSSSPGTYVSSQWGSLNDIPVVGDYDGDGKSDKAVFRPANNVWYILSSRAPGTYTSRQWGIEADLPLSALTHVLESMH